MPRNERDTTRNAHTSGVLTLAGRSRIHDDIVERFGKPHGGVVDMVIRELEARGFFVLEDGYFGGVAADERAYPSLMQREREEVRLAALRADREALAAECGPDDDYE